jgi:hypothetical protein
MCIICKDNLEPKEEQVIGEENGIVHILRRKTCPRGHFLGDEVVWRGTEFKKEEKDGKYFR